MVGDNPASDIAGTFLYLFWSVSGRIGRETDDDDGASRCEWVWMGEYLSEDGSV